MNENRQEEADDYGTADARTPNVLPVSAPDAEAGSYLLEFQRNLIWTDDTFQDSKSLRGPARHHQETRCLGHPEQQTEKNDGRNYSRPKHPSPVVRPSIAQRVVDEIRE